VPIIFEIQDLHISAEHDPAFSFQLFRLQATLVAGDRVDRWERVTFLFNKIGEQWSLMHDLPGAQTWWYRNYFGF